MKSNAEAIKVRKAAESLKRQGEVAKAMDLFSRAASLGDPRAQKKFASMKKGEEIWYRAAMLDHRGHLAEATKLYRRGAKLGNLDSMLNLGTMLDGRGPLPKPKEAVYWFKRGIRGGDSTAAYNLAMHYKNRGQQRWYIHWLSIAAQMGDPDAPDELRGLSLTPDRPKRSLTGLRKRTKKPKRA
jgi:TPR repeat protein